MTSFPFATTPYEELWPSLQQEVTRFLETASSVERPVFLHTMGVPGAGKSTAVSLMEPKLKEMGVSIVAFDRLMSAMPEYQELARTDKEKAFRTCELPARAAGYALLRELVERRVPVFWEHGGSYAQNIDLLRYAKEVQGYRLMLFRVVVSPQVVKARTRKRQEAEGHFTPLTYIDERHQLIEGLFPRFRALVDVYFEVNNEAEVQDFTIPFLPSCEAVIQKWREWAADPVKASLPAKDVA